MDFLGHIPRKKKTVTADEIEATSSLTGSLSQTLVPNTQNETTTKNLSHKSIDQPEHSLDHSHLSTGSNLSLVQESSLDGGSYPEREYEGNFRKSSRQRNSCITIVSEQPMVLRIKTQDIPGFSDPVPRKVTSSRSVSGGRRSGKSNGTATVTRKRKPTSISYQELEDTDEDDILTEAEEQELLRKRSKRRRKESKPLDPLYNAGDNMDMNPDVSNSLGELPLTLGTSVDVSESRNASVIEAPPSGVLSTLWYSRECFLHVFVVDKICGWKTRPKVELVEIIQEAPSTETAITESDDITIPLLDYATAFRLQQNALMSKTIRSDQKKRMAISRLNPTNCPAVQGLAAAETQKQTDKKKLEAKLMDSREEVLLVKWRGRSYFHCSWERASDIQRMDPSTSNIARSKLRKFYQAQEAIYGPSWKQVMEEEQVTAATIYSHGTSNNSEDHSTEASESKAEKVAQDEEFFSPQCLEVERIVACDENEINMEIFANQRALNIKDEAAEVEHNESVNRLDENSRRGEHIDEMESETWDPEDNVRYVVKWKGLPYAEITWEYWRDIKRGAVDEAEDFWLRQRAPDLEKVRRLESRPHPHMSEFMKLQESPVYGNSKKERPVAKLNNCLNTQMHSADTDAGFTLRSYQLEGVNWLLFNWWNRRSCILADEMGLGKTIQSAAFLQELQSQPAVQVRGPFLIVAPLSLIGQWESELATWAPDMNVILYHGSADARNFLVQQEFYYTDQFVPKSIAVKLKKHHVTKFHVLITTYEVVLKDISVLSKIRWRTLVVDEAHRLKNHKAKLFEELASVPRDHCVLLTGTPIANATEELWALLHFANPRSFADRDSFLEKFGEMTDAKQVNELHALLKPYLLRRVKEDVEKSIPNKEETILEVSLTPNQKTFYKAIYERNTSFLFKGAKPNNAPSLMNVIMELRKCCNHPFLVKGAEDRILEEAAAKLKVKMENDGIDQPIDYGKLFEEQLVKASGKMVLMEKLLQKLFDGGHKVLVFSQMVRALDLLEELLKLKKYRYERLDGTTSSASRLHAVERFKRPACERFVMLLSTRAGGLGLNLTVADIVIIFDSDFNPQNDLQAMARAHRIGQTRAVKVYRLITAKTYEMHMFHTASLKLGLERAVLSQNREQHFNENEDATKSTRSIESAAKAKEIDNLLKKGAYDVFRDDDDTEAEKFMETDIDQLLEKSSKKVTYGPGATSALGSGLGSFSKASFVATTEGGEKDVDLDDPDFWKKAVGFDTPPEDTPEDVAAMLDDGVKRNRKQVQQYDPYANNGMADQLRKDKIALEKLFEKEERDRQKDEKRMKKHKGKDDIKKDLNEANNDGLQGSMEMVSASQSSPSIDVAYKKLAVKLPKLSKEVRPKKTKKSERMKSLRRAENDDPPIERFKQAWDIPQRNRATATAIRFGFGRFCKVRTESNLTSLPTQDLEVFIRAYIFQMSLQVAVTLLTRMKDGSTIPDVRLLLQEWIGFQSTFEVDWLSDSICSAMKLQAEVESGRRFLRIPLTLTEPVYVTDLREGAAFRALRRIGILARLNTFVESCIDSILAALGNNELGKRGCPPGQLRTLDADLKARFVTTEELVLAVSSSFTKLDLKAPASWWDRSCDVGLIVGTFVHGLSNYELMLRDHSIPFAEKIKKHGQHDISCKTAVQLFRSAASATRNVFEDALEAMQIKAELEVQAAVAAAAKAAAQREKDAARIREGGAAAEVAAKNMPETQVENAFEFDGTDSHFVTLPRMHQRIHVSIRMDTTTTQKSTFQGVSDAEVVPEVDTAGDDFEPRGVGNPAWRTRERYLLPMPDSRVLDYRLVRLLKAIENDSLPNGVNDGRLWKRSHTVSVNLKMRKDVISLFASDIPDIIGEYSGIGLNGNQCGISHRTLNDGSDYSFGSASNQLAQLAYGTDAPRYLRALGVPMNVTRFGISGLVYAESSCVEELMRSEKLRYFGREDPKQSTKNKFIDGEASVRQKEYANGAMNGNNVSLKEDIEGDQKLSSKICVDGISVVTSEFEKTDILGTTENECAEQKVKADKGSGPVDPVDLIDGVFRDNPKLRASVCLAVIVNGFPSSSSLEKETLNDDLLQALCRESYADKNSEGPIALFDIHKFRNAVAAIAPDVDIPETESLQKYVEKSLLPHCLRLCVSGNGPSTRNARGSEGDYETAFGIGIHPESSRSVPTPIPDPCLSLQEHSLEALSFANALLRRVRLLRSCIHLCSTKIQTSKSKIDAVARSKEFCYLAGMPIWWCPWIHDVAVLIQAATYGLFSIIPNRQCHDILSPDQVHAFFRKTIAVQSKAFLQHSSSEQIDIWIAHHAKHFPTLNQLERRLGFLCSQLTSDLEEETRFDFIPMFDHGGWPRD